MNRNRCDYTIPRPAFLHNVHKYLGFLVMESQLIQMMFEVDLETNEKLKLPEHLTENPGAGKLAYHHSAKNGKAD